MAGEIQIGGTTFASESGGTVTVANVDSATNRTNLGLGSIATQNANAVAITGGSVSGASIVPTSSFSFRNRIINGDMRIDQRNAGSAVTPTDGQYTLDRIACALSQASKYTVQQSTTVPTGFKNSLVITSSSSYSLGVGDFFFISTKIEGQNIVNLNWGSSDAKQITISFWVRSSLTGQFGGTVRNSGRDRSYPFSYTISSADTWEQKSITIAGDTSGTWLTTNGIGLEVCFNLGTGSTYSGTAGSWAGTNYVAATGDTSVVSTSGATLYITGVQLEEGSVATPFEHRPIGVELSLCQRYYEVIPSIYVGFANATVNFTQARHTMTYATQKRTSSPTVTYGTISSGFSISSLLVSSSQLFFEIAHSGTNDFRPGISTNTTILAEL